MAYFGIRSRATFFVTGASLYRSSEANASRYQSMGLNFECVMSSAGKVASCVGVTDFGLYNMFI